MMVSEWMYITKPLYATGLDSPVDNQRLPRHICDRSPLSATSAGTLTLPITIPPLYVPNVSPLAAPPSSRHSHPTSPCPTIPGA